MCKGSGGSSCGDTVPFDEVRSLITIFPRMARPTQKYVNRGNDVPGCTFRFSLTYNHPTFGGLRVLEAYRKPPGPGAVVSWRIDSVRVVQAPFHVVPRSTSLSFAVVDSFRGPYPPDPSLTNPTRPVSGSVLTPPSSHGWDRYPSGATADGYDIHRSPPPTSPSAIPDRRSRYRSRERSFRRTRPSLVESSGGEGVVGVRRRRFDSNVGRRQQPVASERVFCW